ncbi:MAG: PKD domain-containing protein [Bacteroidetes bacterium]|nr:PKD domain-containing protein [Bacteroidota bacterium]
MKKALNSLLLFVLLAFSKPVLSQIDTVFWFAAPWVTPDHAGRIPMALRISTFGNATTVRVKQPASAYDTTFTIAPNTIYSKFLSHIVDSLESKPADTRLRTGVRITSDYPITVVYEFISSGNNPETYSLKGQNGMGTEFVTPFQTLWNNKNLGAGKIQPYSIFSVCATQNNTTVWITPRCPIVGGHPAGQTFSITLNAGQVYTAQNITQIENVIGSNLSGSIVTSDKPVTVTVSDDSVNPSGGGGCYDLMGDQIVPVDVIGTEYIVNKGFLNTGSDESMFVVAKDNFTSVTINDGTVTTVLLNQGDTKQYSITQGLTHIQANKPVYVIHMSGYGCELGEAIIPPLNCSGSNQVSFTRTNSQSFLLNLLCKTSAVGSFTLNGSTTLVPASAFTVVPGTAGVWSGAQISFNTTDIPVSAASLISNNSSPDSLFSMGVINGGASTGCLYHYLSSFLRKVFINAGNDKNMCTATTTVALNGTISGGASTGFWASTNGTGTFTNANNLNTVYTLSTNDLTKSQIKFVLTSTGNCNPVRDTIVLNLFRSPIVDAGNNDTLCKNNISPVNITGSLQYAAGASWSGGSGGSFGNTGSLNTTYLPSPADLTAGSVKLKLTSTGSFNGCPNTSDSLMIHFTPAPFVGAGGDVSVCANNPTVAISGTVSAGATTGIWSGTGSGLFSPSTTSLNAVYQLSPADISQGNLVIRLTSTNNGRCKAVYDTIIVTVTPKPNVDAGLSDTICSSNTLYNLAGSVTGGASAGFWTSSGNGTFGNANNLVTSYTLGQIDTLNGYVKLFLTSTGSNCLAEKDSMTLTIAKAPLVNAGPDRLVCDNQLLITSGNVTGFTNTGVWSTAGTGVFTPSDSLLTTYYQPSALDIAQGYVKLILTSTFNAGCVAVKDTVKLTFKGAPDANFVMQNQCVKDNGSYTDNSTTPTGTVTAWYWDFGDGSATSIAQNAQHIYNTPGTYTISHVATSSNGCTDTVKKPIEVYFLPQALYFTNTVCKGNNTQFIDSSKSVSGSIIAWNWNFGDGVTTGVQNPKHAYGATGTYTVNLTVTSSFGCKDTINKAVTVIPGPKADFDMNPNPVEALATVNYTDLSTGPASLVSWYWNLGDLSVQNVQNPQHAYADHGDYTVTLIVKDINGCVDTVRKDISVVLLPEVPTAFSPNADGQNDMFLVRGGPFKTIHMRIYNNWGQLIYESSDQALGWDGTFNGTAQPIGVYVWVVEVEMFGGKQIKRTGDVTLLR